MKEWIKKNWIISAIILFLSVALIALLVLSFKNFEPNNVNFYLALSSIVSSLLIVMTLFITIKNNKENNDNFINAQEESNSQFQEERKEVKAQFEEQQKFLHRQQFETTFFNMMNQLEDIVSKLSLEYTVERKITPPFYPITLPSIALQTEKYERTTTKVVGRDVFEHLYKGNETMVSKDSMLFLNNYIESVKSEDISETDKQVKVHIALSPLRGDVIDRFYDGKFINRLTLKEKINVLGVSEYKKDDSVIILDHYFRYLYRIVKFVDEAHYLDSEDSIECRYNYTCILRATLSPYELVFLFYNGLVYNNLKRLIEKYCLLNNLRPELTANSTRDYEMNYIGSPGYDYYNYISGLEESVKIDYKMEKYQLSAVEK